MNARLRQPGFRLIGVSVGAFVCVISAGATAQQSRLNELLGGKLDKPMRFPVPTPKQKIYGGTEDIRWMSEVEAMLEVKARQLPALTGVRAGTKIALCFEVDTDGNPLNLRACGSTAHRRLEAFARRVVTAAAPFLPPPAGRAKSGLRWVYEYGGSVRLP